MTKKHFIFIANVISKLDVDRETKAEIALAFSDELANTNEKFNTTVFTVACINDNALASIKKSGGGGVDVPLLNKPPLAHLTGAREL